MVKDTNDVTKTPAQVSLTPAASQTPPAEPKPPVAPAASNGGDRLPSGPVPPEFAHLPPLPGIGIDLITLGKLLAQSGYFSDIRQISQAVVKVLLGQELGVGPITAMMSIHVVENKPVLSASLMAAKILSSGRYTYRVTKVDDTQCEVTFFEVDPKTKARGEELGKSTFSTQDAQRAGLTTKHNWKNYPRNMMFARALSNGAKWYCPDVFGGPVYVPEEADELREPETIGEPAPAAGETRTDALKQHLKTEEGAGERTPAS